MCQMKNVIIFLILSILRYKCIISQGLPVTFKLLQLIYPVFSAFSMPNTLLLQYVCTTLEIAVTSYSQTTCYTILDLSWFIFSHEDLEHKWASFVTFNILPSTDCTVALDLGYQR